MEFLWLIVKICIEIFLILWGADRFTDGACAIARKWGVSELLIGLTVVSMGTSLPEFVVSFFSSLTGSADMSVGNIVGSNIFNTLVIVGSSCMVLQLSVERSTLRRDLPVCLLATLGLLTCGWFSHITRWNALLLFLVFVFYIGYSIRLAMKQKGAAEKNAKENTTLTKVLCLILIGMACLAIGGKFLVDDATQVARMFGVSEAVIGLTILAGGTSLPELATSIVAARKGSVGLALGNAIGSNIFNITFVLGICGMINPMKIQQLTTADWTTFVASIIILWIFAATRRTLQRWEGLVLLLCYAFYLTYMLLSI